MCSKASCVTVLFIKLPPPHHLVLPKRATLLDLNEITLSPVCPPVTPGPIVWASFFLAFPQGPCRVPKPSHPFSVPAIHPNLPPSIFFPLFVCCIILLFAVFIANPLPSFDFRFRSVNLSYFCIGLSRFLIPSSLLLPCPFPSHNPPPHPVPPRVRCSVSHPKYPISIAWDGCSPSYPTLFHCRSLKSPDCCLLHLAVPPLTC